jgi:hypothetical protein
MPWFDGATKAPIPPQERLEQSKASYLTKTQIILHSAVVAYPDAMRGWKGQGWKKYSTFFVLLTGEIVQLVDSQFKAVANASANSSAISVETEDQGMPDTVPWNDKQVESLAKLIQWACKNHSIPLKPCPGVNDPGIGFHTMWGDSPRYNTWLGETPKTCPGLIRIPQFFKEILPHVGYAPADDAVNEVWRRWIGPPKWAGVPGRQQPPGGGKGSRKKKKGARAAVGDWNTDDAFRRVQLAQADDDLFRRRRDDA